MTDTKLTAGGVFTPTLAIISTDQETILGDGTPGNPIRLSSSGGTGSRLVGTLAEASSESIGLAVRLLLSGQIYTFGRTAKDNSLAAAQTIGIVSSFDEVTGEVSVITSGEVTLTTEQWDSHTGQSGGLTSSSIYYVSGTGGLSSSGTLSTSPASVSGQYIAQVGMGESATTMILSTPSVPLLVP